MIKLIYACDEAGGIGRNNTIPWDLKDDMKHFKKLTTNNVVIMGRKTFESLNNKPLKDRLNIVLSRDEKYRAEMTEKLTLKQKDTDIHVLFFANFDIERVIKLSQEEFKTHDIFIIGGAEIYKQSIEFIDEVIQTKILDEFECDTFFTFDESKFEIIASEKLKDSKSEIEYELNTFKRK